MPILSPPTLLPFHLSEGNVMFQPAKNTRRAFGRTLMAAGAALGLPVVSREQSARDEFTELVVNLKPEYQHAVRLFARALADSEGGSR